MIIISDLPSNVTPENLAKLVEWRNQSLEFLRTCKPTVLEKQELWAKESHAKGDRYWMIFLVKETGVWESTNVLIGYGGFNHIIKQNKTAEMGLLIAPEYRNKGYGTIAAMKILTEGFMHQDLNCIFSEVYDTSSVWKKFCEKLGFRKEGKLRARKFWEDKYYDSTIGSLLKEEWKNHEYF